MPLPPGTRLGPYEILAPIGAGGMGEVYRATDSRLGREIALKVLPEELSRDGSLRARFEHEARAASALNHPNIVSIHDFGQDNQTLYIVTELVDGEPLRALIARGPVATRKIVDIGKQIADGLAAAHAVGIVHRDLKPDNVLITRDGRVKIIDFGLAKRQFLGSDAVTAVPAATLTLPGAVMGTIGYMSPEQIRGQDVDARTDIFSLGVILYEMASGGSAFTGASGADVMSSILREEPPELKNPELPPGLIFIIRRCLEKTPAARFQNASDLSFAIGSLSLVPATMVPKVDSQPVPKKKSYAFFGAAAASALAAAGGIYWFQRPVQPAHVMSPVAAVTMAQADPPASKPQPSSVKSVGKPVKAQAPVSKPASEPESKFEGPNKLLEQGQQLNQQRKYDEAIEVLNRAIKLKANLPLAFLARGRSYQHQQNFERALSDFTEAIRLKPDLAVAYVDRGHVHNQQGEYQKAIPDFDEALKLNSELLRAYEGRAMAKFRSGDRKGAAADRKHAAELRKPDPQ